MERKDDKIVDVVRRKTAPELRALINEAQKWGNTDKDSFREYLANNYEVLYGLHLAVIEYQQKSQGHEKQVKIRAPPQFKAPDFNRNYSQQYRQPYNQAYGPPPGKTPPECSGCR